MTLTNSDLEMLATPKPGPITSRLPSLFARKNAALIAGLKASGTKTRPEMKSGRVQ